MKKLLLSTALFSASFAINAQIDTLSEYYSSPSTFYIIDQAAPIDSGFVTGNNFYGDLGKLSLFDNTNGVNNGGSIKSILLGIALKNGTGSFQVGVWADNAGAPANLASPLGVVTVDLADVDTTSAAYLPIGAGPAFYNHSATFSSAIPMPAGNKFWAGVILPVQTGLISLYSTEIDTYPAGDTHCGEIFGDGTFHTFGDAAGWGGLGIAMAIFPVVDFVAGVNENVISAKVYPNPANDVLNISINEEIESVSIVTLDGKVVATSTGSTVNVAELTSGMYIYEITTANGNVARDTFMKK